MSSDRVPAALRLTFRVERGKVDLIGRQTVAMIVSASQPLEARSDLAGWWAELQDLESRVLYRTLLPDPLEREHPTSEGMARAPRATAANFQLAVPDLASAYRLILFGSFNGAAEPAQ